VERAGLAADARAVLCQGARPDQVQPAKVALVLLRGEAAEVLGQLVVALRVRAPAEAVLPALDDEGVGAPLDALRERRLVVDVVRERDARARTGGVAWETARSGRRKLHGGEATEARADRVSNDTRCFVKINP